MTEDKVITDKYRPGRWLRYYTGNMKRQIRAVCNLENYRLSSQISTLRDFVY
jgi:hypothetical protein